MDKLVPVINVYFQFTQFPSFTSGMTDSFSVHVNCIQYSVIAKSIFVTLLEIQRFGMTCCFPPNSSSQQVLYKVETLQQGIPC